MANLQSAFTDETYENQRGEAERQFHACFQAWLKAMKPGTLSDLVPENPLRLRPEEIKLMGDLAESCEAFVKAELSAFVSLLKRLGMPASQAVKASDDHRKATIQETHVQKWEYGLTKLFPVLRKDPKMSSLIWSQVDRSVLDFVRLDLHSLLWLPPREHAPDLRTSQEQVQLEDKLRSEQELLAVAEQQARGSPQSSGAVEARKPAQLQVREEAPGAHPVAINQKVQSRGGQRGQKPARKQETVARHKEWAQTVATIHRELSTLKPQMYGEEESYNELRSLNSKYLTFQITETRQALKLKVEHIMLAKQHLHLSKELAAAYHKRSFESIRRAWISYKPTDFSDNPT